MTTRDRIMIAVVAAVVAVAGAWLMVVQPKRDQAAKLGTEVSSEQAQLDSARQLIAQGEAARVAYAHNYTAVARLGEAVPADDNVPSLIYQLQNAASGSSVDFRALQLSSSGAAAAPTPPAASTPPAAAATASSAGSSPASSSPPAATSSPAATASAPTTQSAIAALPPGAVVGPAGFPTEPFTFTFRGNFFHLADFFKRLQSLVVATNKSVLVSGRLMTLNAISLGPAPQGFPQIQALISATTYLVPPGEGLMNGATPAAPAAGSSQPVSSAGSPSTPAAVATPPLR